MSPQRTPNYDKGEEALATLTYVNLLPKERASRGPLGPAGKFNLVAAAHQHRQLAASMRAQSDLYKGTIIWQGRGGLRLSIPKQPLATRGVTL